MSAQREVAERQQKFVRIEKKKLLDKIKENRTRHQKLWEASIKGWKTATAVALEKYSTTCTEMAEKSNALADKMRSTDETDVDQKLISELGGIYPHLPKRPENHVEEYDEIIERLEFSLDEEINLTHQDFNQYVRDKWGWKGEFIATSNLYSPELAADFGETPK